MKIAIVTGASSGMGREAVLELADRFGGLSEIWVIARRRERLEALEDQVPARLRILALDLSQEADLRQLELILEQEKPQVKCLINAAGYGKISKVGEISRQEETGMVRLNCETLCAVTHMVLPHMDRNSRILQFASAAAFLPQPGFAVYAATKAFVLSYSRALNQELVHRRITVTAVCPGPVRTEFFQVAETKQEMSAYKKLFMANPKRVVHQAVRDSMMGKTVSVYGGFMKAFRLFCKAVPHGWILRFLKEGEKNEQEG